MHHLYRRGNLAPDDEIQVQNAKSIETFNLLLRQPFAYYFSPQGYHNTSKMLFMLYYVYVCWYAYKRPIRGVMIDDHFFPWEILLWTCNLGYVVYELFECGEKGLVDYFDLRVGGQANMMDAYISIMWVILFAIKVYFVAYDTTHGVGKSPDKWYHSHGFDVPENGEIEFIHMRIIQGYLFLFAIQICALSVRSLTLFSHTHHFGSLLRVIKMMSMQILRFFYIYFIIGVGFVFGVWFVVIANECAAESNDGDNVSVSSLILNDYECMEFDVGSISEAFSYIFQIFVTTGDLSGVADQPTAIILIVIGM